ncbi:MAG: glucosaminidase domain-containing protein [Pseudomonadales bacterium]|nr:glucosaminidase domain-containing protein [Pseudomonadales bacterium]
MKEYLVIPIILVTVIVIGLIHEYRQGSGRDSQTEESIPDFKAYIDVKKKKHAFFEYMLPLIRQSNKRVMVEREILLSMSSAKKLSQSDQLILTSYIHKYKLPKNTTPDFEAIDALLNRIDRVPASLILAQSANESAWGTSRFAKKGKNFFGIWCFT